MAALMVWAFKAHVREQDHIKIFWQSCAEAIDWQVMRRVELNELPGITEVPLDGIIGASYFSPCTFKECGNAIYMLVGFNGSPIGKIGLDGKILFAAKIQEARFPGVRICLKRHVPVIKPLPSRVNLYDTHRLNRKWVCLTDDESQANEIVSQKIIELIDNSTCIIQIAMSKDLIVFEGVRANQHEMTLEFWNECATICDMLL